LFEEFVLRQREVEEETQVDNNIDAAFSEDQVIEA
jgi:hypothetical protein